LVKDTLAQKTLTGTVPGAKTGSYGKVESTNNLIKFLFIKIKLIKIISHTDSKRHELFSIAQLRSPRLGRAQHSCWQYKQRENSRLWPDGQHYHNEHSQK